MRDISSTVLSAQQAASSEPFIRLVFTSPDGVTEYDLSSNVAGEDRRLIQLEHHEEPYDDYAVLYFTNETNDFPDIRGYYVDIGYGYRVSDTSYSYPTSRLWVKSQMTLSAEGQKQEVIELEGVWSMLAEQLIRTGDPPFYVRDEDNNGYYGYGKTVYWLLQDIFNAMDYEDYDFILVTYGDQDDGIIDTFQPKFEINALQQFEDARTLITRLIYMTSCYIRSKALHGAATGILFEIRYPRDTDPVDVTYYSDQEPVFYEYVESRRLMIPNHIIVFANEGEDGLWTDIITAEAEDSDQIALYRDVTEIHTAASVDNQTDADARATALLNKVYAETLAGRLIIPHDIRLELYDRVAIVDNR